MIKFNIHDIVCLNNYSMYHEDEFKTTFLRLLRFQNMSINVL